jgi:hypothetical protein
MRAQKHQQKKTVAKWYHRTQNAEIEGQKPAAKLINLTVMMCSTLPAHFQQA